MSDLKGMKFLESINSQLVIEYYTHGVGVEVGTESDERIHRYRADISLYNFETTKKTKIGEVDFGKYNSVDYEKIDPIELMQDLKREEYFERLFIRLYSDVSKKLVAIDNRWYIDTIWCLANIALLPKYRGVGLAQMVIENLQKVYMTPNQTNLFFGFAFPPQFWDGQWNEPRFYKGDNKRTLAEAEEKIEEFYKKSNFTYLKDLTKHHDPEVVKAALFDGSRGSHLFFKVV